MVRLGSSGFRRRLRHQGTMLLVKASAENRVAHRRMSGWVMGNGADR
jgi:hypothetical protein